MIDSLWRTSYLLKGTRICKKNKQLPQLLRSIQLLVFLFCKTDLSLYLPPSGPQVHVGWIFLTSSPSCFPPYSLMYNTVSDDTACLWRGGVISCRLINIFLVLWGTNYLVCLFSALFQNRTVVACLLSLKRLSLNIVVRTNVWSEHYEASVWRILNF